MVFGRRKRVGLGSKVIFRDSGYDPSITSYSFSGVATEALDATDMQSAEPGPGEFGGMEFEPAGLADPGNLELTGFFDPSKIPPIGTKERVRVEFRKAGQESIAPAWEGIAVVQGFSAEVPNLELGTHSITLKLSGVWRLTPAEEIA